LLAVSAATGVEITRGLEDMVLDVPLAAGAG
jgi:hypothetical protein